MVKKFIVRIMVEGILYDVNKLLEQNEPRRAFELLEKKITEIRRLERQPRDYKLIWN